MHKLSTRLLSLLLGVMLIVSMSFTAFAAEEDEYRPYGTQTADPYFFTTLYSGDVYYGELSPAAKKIYTGLKAAMANPANSRLAVEFPLSSVNAKDLDYDTLIKAYSALRNEWPELFQWADLSFAIALESNNVNWRVTYFLGVQDAYRGAERSYVSPSPDGPSIIYYYWDIKPATINEQQKKAEAKANEVLRAAPAGDDYDKVVYFNKWIVDNTEYDHEALETNIPEYDNTFHMAGVFIDGKAVCEGYAKAFKYLCDKSGIECLYITGDLFSMDGTSGPHAWNYVKLDGAWYIVDTTTNDGNDNIALCVGSNDWFASYLEPDGAYDYDNKVFIDTPGVVLNTDNYGDRAKSISFTAPAKTEYFAGDKLELAGGKVTVNRYNGKTEDLDMTAEMIGGLDMNKVGVQNATVSYSGKTAAEKLVITVKNAPLTATIHEAIVNYPLGVSSLDLSKGYAMVTYADKTVTRPKLDDKEKVAVNLPIGVSGLEAGIHTVEVTILGDKPLTVSFEIGVGEENTVPELPPEKEPEVPVVPPTDNGSSGGGSSGSTSKVPNALPPDKAVSAITNLDPKSPPAGSKTMTVGGKKIVTVPMAITESGLLGVDIITQLGALPAGVGVVINQGSGLPEILIPSGFKFVKEPGQFALSLKVTNELPADAKAEVAKALEAAKRTQVYAGTLGGVTVSKFPVPFTIMVPVKLAEGTAVTVQMVNPVTGKQLSTVTVKVVGGIVSFPVNTTGGIVISTAK